MIAFVLLVASTTAQADPAAIDKSFLSEAAYAIDQGRLEQARLMIARAIGAGVTGAPVDNLVADLSFASRKYEDALSEYKAIASAGHRDQRVCERAVISALQLGRAADAKPFADCATAGPAAGWRAWNARGVIADLSQDWKDADQYYARAHEFAPARAEVINNQGWSLVLRGEWATAVPYFQQAVKLDPTSRRMGDNLDLAQTALAADLPARRAGESSSAWAARLNDAGVAARLLGDRSRAVAAFTQALYASDQWYARAANNLAIASKP
jgi:Flp pilus assembly protein TadD